VCPDVCGAFFIGRIAKEEHTVYGLFAVRLEKTCRAFCRSRTEKYFSSLPYPELMKYHYLKKLCRALFFDA
jgi:hypothetical protein